MVSEEERDKGLVEKKKIDIQQEFISWLRTVHNLSVNSKFSIEQKRNALNEKLKELSEDAYQVYMYQIMGIIQNKKEQCVEYPNSEAQVDNILSWLPRLQDHKELILLIIQERRKKYGLTI